MVVTAATMPAQQLRGVVRDSATRTPLSGVVITLLDAGGGTLARAISNERGAYVIGPTTRARAVGAIRIGFRPRNVPYSDGATLDLTMTPIPPLLEPVTVRAATHCPARTDRLPALSLLQQARAGLLATVTARQTNKASLVRLRFIREYDNSGKWIVDQRVTIDSSGGLGTSFGAVRTGAAFVADGFVERRTRDGVPIHYGPDAETLLDDDFSAGYCFQLAEHDDARRNEVGLVFKPASRRNGRVDIDGTLWIDTVAKALHDIQFAYVGDEHPTGAPQTGGRIEFRTMANGIVIIDRWALRLSAAHPDTAASGAVRTIYNLQELGGEVASATWNDGTAWEASLGKLRALALDYQAAMTRGVVLRLKNTDYIASPSARGIAEIPYLLPGPYIAMVSDSATQRLGILLPTSVSFEAERDSVTQHSLVIPQAEGLVLGRCLSGYPKEGEPERMVIRVVDASGNPAVGAVVDITLGSDPPNSATESIDTDDSGTALSCLRYHRNDPFTVNVTYDTLPPFTAQFRYADKTITIRLQEKPKR